MFGNFRLWTNNYSWSIAGVDGKCGRCGNIGLGCVSGSSISGICGCDGSSGLTSGVGDGRMSPGKYGRMKSNDCSVLPESSSNSAPSNSAGNMECITR